ncbi:MAG TPA: hypothetical protein VHQ90_01330 [Thermoanaerobaculia bacterium]|nr:hypothetical protein [Thermoanaerobaculia bacterium]
MSHLGAVKRRELIVAAGREHLGLLRHLADCPRCRAEIARELAPRASRGEKGREADAAAQRLWRRIGGRVSSAAGRIERERAQALGLVEEILAMPEQALAGAAADPRFRVPEVAWQLLEASRGSDEPLAALSLAGLAQEIAFQLAGTCPPAVCAALRVETSCEVADRLRGCGRLDCAAAQLQAAAHQFQAALLPELGFARAVYCRSLARLRRAERRREEALALIERSVTLFDQARETAPVERLEAGESQVEHGWILLEDRQLARAVAVLRQALARIGDVPRAAVHARHGLALALARSGRERQAEEVLAEAQKLAARVGGPGARLRLLRTEAQILAACGQTMAARRRLGEALGALLLRGEDYEAAMVLLDVVTLYEAHGCASRALPRLQRPRQRLAASPKVHPRARAVLDFALRLVEAGHGSAGEVLGSAVDYLREARYAPDLPFAPTAARSQVAWEDLGAEQRRDVYRDFLGLGAIVLGALPLRVLEDHSAHSLDPPQRDLLSWAYEIVSRVRLIF